MNDKTDSPQTNAVFHLTTPEQLFIKLDWELDNLTSAIKEQDHERCNPKAAAYHAFNFAVTAWHLTDWVWKYVSDGRRVQFAKELGFEITNRPNEDLKSFQKAIRERSRALQICWELANGSKHLDRHRDSKLEAMLKVEAKCATASEFRAGQPLQTFSYDFVVDWNGQTLRAIDVFAEARDFWMGFLGDRDLLGPIYMKSMIEVTITRGNQVTPLT